MGATSHSYPTYHSNHQYLSNQYIIRQWQYNDPQPAITHLHHLQNQPSSNYTLRLFSAQLQQHPNSFRLSAKLQYPHTTLRQQLNTRQANNTKFNEDQIWHIIYQISNCLYYLKSNHHTNPSHIHLPFKLNLDAIFISDDQHFKISHPDILNNLSIMTPLKETMVEFGCILMELCLLYKPKFITQAHYQQLKSNYSHTLILAIHHMIHNYVTFKGLIKLSQHSIAHPSNQSINVDYKLKQPLPTSTLHSHNSINTLSNRSLQSNAQPSKSTKPIKHQYSNEVNITQHCFPKKSVMKTTKNKQSQQPSTILTPIHQVIDSSKKQQIRQSMKPFNHDERVSEVAIRPNENQQTIDDYRYHNQQLHLSPVQQYDESNDYPSDENISILQPNSYNSFHNNTIMEVEQELWQSDQSPNHNNSIIAPTPFIQLNYMPQLNQIYTQKVGPHGQTYQGQYQNGKINGYGKLYSEDAQLIYEGYWKNGQFHGKGRLINISIEFNEGGFDYTDFSKLKGQWQYFEGYFIEGIKNGEGVLRLSNGQVMDGKWDKNNLNGGGVFYSVEAKAIEGMWKDNLFKGNQIQE